MSSRGRVIQTPHQSGSACERLCTLNTGSWNTPNAPATASGDFTVIGGTGAYAGRYPYGALRPRTVTQTLSASAATPVGGYGREMRVTAFVFGSMRKSA